MAGITISVGGFISGAATCGDYNRYSRDGKSAALSCLFGVIPAGVGALACGAVLSICSGDSDITVMFANVGLPVAGTDSGYLDNECRECLFGWHCGCKYF